MGTQHHHVAPTYGEERNVRRLPSSPCYHYGCYDGGGTEDCWEAGTEAERRQALLIGQPTSQHGSAVTSHAESDPAAASSWVCENVRMVRTRERVDALNSWEWST
jgi:hypothetical protein